MRSARDLPSFDASLWRCALVGCALLTGCTNIAPPKSVPPTGDAALERMRGGAACADGLQASAKIDYYGDQGRVRGELLMIAKRPASLRMDIVSPFGATLATLTSDSTKFALADLRNKQFLFGPAKTCNIARLTHMPIPAPALVDLLRGVAPVLKRSSPATIAWDRHGYYVVTIASTRQANEVIHLAPHPDDMGRPWEEQRLRLKFFSVEQAGKEMYHAELDEHAAAKSLVVEASPEDIVAGIAPAANGAACNIEVPRVVHVESPSTGDDVLFRYSDISWNPTPDPSIFTQMPAAGLERGFVGCADGE